MWQKHPFLNEHVWQSFVLTKIMQNHSFPSRPFKTGSSLPWELRLKISWSSYTRTSRRLRIPPWAVVRVFIAVPAERTSLMWRRGALIKCGSALSAFGPFLPWLLYNCTHTQRERDEMRDLFWSHTLWFSLSCSGAQQLQTDSSGNARRNKEQKSRAELSHCAASGPGKIACIFNVLKIRNTA